MAQITPQYAEILQKKHGFKFWKVYDRSKKEIDNQTKEISVNESAQLLQDTLCNITGDIAFVTFWEDTPKKGGKQPERLDITVKCNDGIVNSRTNTGGGVAISDFIALQKELFETRLQIERERINAPGVEKTTMVEKFLSYAMERDLIPQAIGAITAMKNKQTQEPEPIAGPDNLAETLKKFSQVDPTYQETLKKMADYLAKNPGVLPQIKSIIGA
jgi:hypothetical protein